MFLFFFKKTFNVGSRAFCETSQGEVFSPPMRSKHMKALEMATHGNLTVGQMGGGSTWRFFRRKYEHILHVKQIPFWFLLFLGIIKTKGLLHLYPVIYQCTSLHFHHRGFSWQILVCQSHSYNHSLPNVAWVMSGRLSNNWTLFSERWEFNCQVSMLSTKATFSLGAWRCLCFQWPDAPHSTLSSRRA